MDRKGLIVISLEESQPKGRADPITTFANVDHTLVLDVVCVGDHFGRPLNRTAVADTDTTIAAVARPLKDRESRTADTAQRVTGEGLHPWRSPRSSESFRLLLGGDRERS